MNFPFNSYAVFDLQYTQESVSGLVNVSCLNIFLSIIILIINNEFINACLIFQLVLDCFVGHIGAENTLL